MARKLEKKRCKETDERKEYHKHSKCYKNTLILKVKKLMYMQLFFFLKQNTFLMGNKFLRTLLDTHPIIHLPSYFFLPDFILPSKPALFGNTVLLNFLFCFCWFLRLTPLFSFLICKFSSLLFCFWAIVV